MNECYWYVFNDRCGLRKCDLEDKGDSNEDDLLHDINVLLSEAGERDLESTVKMKQREIILTQVKKNTI